MSWRCLKLPAATMGIAFYGALVPAVFADGGSVVIAELGKFASRPGVIAQGASNELYDLRWSRWGGAVATAAGRATYYGSEPKPGPLADDQYSGSIALRAYRIAGCDGRRVYSRLAVRFTERPNPPTGGPLRYTEKLYCNGGDYG